MDHCSCAHGRRRCDALARGDDGIWSTMSSLAVSQEITAERALSTPPWTSKHHSAYQIALRTPIYSDFRLFSIRFSCSEKLRCHPKTQIPLSPTREGVARAAATPGTGATDESESSTTGSTFSRKFVAFGGATQPPRSSERARPSVSLRQSRMQNRFPRATPRPRRPRTRSQPRFRASYVG